MNETVTIVLRNPTETALTGTLVTVMRNDTHVLSCTEVDTLEVGLPGMLTGKRVEIPLQNIAVLVHGTGEAQ